MKFIYPAVFRKNESGRYHGFFLIWHAARQKETLWRMPLTMPMMLPTTGSMQNLWKTKWIFPLFLMNPT